MIKCKHTLFIHTDEVMCVALSFDEKFCVSGSIDFSIKILRIAARKLVRTI